MSQYRKRYRVILDGQPHEVTTSARDFAQVEQVGETAKPMDMVFQALHAALLRADVSGVPSSYPAFLDQLDDFTDLDSEDTSAAEPVSPTLATV